MCTAKPEEQAEVEPLTGDSTRSLRSPFLTFDGLMCVAHETIASRSGCQVSKPRHPTNFLQNFVGRKGSPRALVDCRGRSATFSAPVE